MPNFSDVLKHSKPLPKKPTILLKNTNLEQTKENKETKVILKRFWLKVKNKKNEFLPPYKIFKFDETKHKDLKKKINERKNKKVMVQKYEVVNGKKVKYYSLEKPKFVKKKLKLVKKKLKLVKLNTNVKTEVVFEYDVTSLSTRSTVLEGGEEADDAVFSELLQDEEGQPVLVAVSQTAGTELGSATTGGSGWTEEDQGTVPLIVDDFVSNMEGDCSYTCKAETQETLTSDTVANAVFTENDSDRLDLASTLLTAAGASEEITMLSGGGVEISVNQLDPIKDYILSDININVDSQELCNENPQDPICLAQNYIIDSYRVDDHVAIGATYVTDLGDAGPPLP